jgi:glutathione S-transferase
MEIVVGTKKWSTWSMRPWLALRRSGLAFSETLVELREENGVSEAAIRVHSPSGLVPVLKDGDLTIWDSLAICEHLAGLSPGLWPSDPARLALGRSAAAEMHSGFASLRGECPMDLTAKPASTPISEATQKDVRRIVSVWNELLGRFGGTVPGRRLVDRRRLLHAGGDPLAHLWDPAQRLRRRRPGGRIRPAAAADAGVPGVGGGGAGMKRLAGLLRAVNVGGRKVLMADLKRVAADAGFDAPATLLASGNLLFGATLPPAEAGGSWRRRSSRRSGSPPTCWCATGPSWRR